MRYLFYPSFHEQLNFSVVVKLWSDFAAHILVNGLLSGVRGVLLNSVESSTARSSCAMQSFCNLSTFLCLLNKGSSFLEDPDLLG